MKTITLLTTLAACLLSSNVMALETVAETKVYNVVTVKTVKNNKALCNLYDLENTKIETRIADVITKNTVEVYTRNTTHVKIKKVVCI